MKDKENNNRIIIDAIVLIIIALSIVIIITLKERNTETITDTISYAENGIIENKVNNNENKNTIANNLENIEITNNTQNTTTSNILTENDKLNINNTTKIKSKVSPSGFSGSSMLQVVLYEDKSAYLIHYNGEGYNEEHIFNKELIATNVEEIYSRGKAEDFESIVLKGQELEIISSSYNWITFE